MKELGDILLLWDQARAAGEDAVLATVVKTRGSSYRNPGARFLITASGLRAGSVSGGCLEDDLAKKAFWLSENGCTVRKYDTTPDGEIASSGYGLGCNGTIYVELERLAGESAGTVELIRNVLHDRRCAVLAHRTDADHAGERMTIDTSGRLRHTIASPDTAAFLETEAQTALRQLSSRTVLLPSGEEIFIEVIAPAPHLLIFGAGSDAIPLTRLAKFLGWRVSVFDGRSHYLRREKLPEADTVSLRAAGGSAEKLRVDAWTVAVLMSHSYAQDLGNLTELAAYRMPYLGILGPRKRTVQLLSDAGLKEDSVTALHAPMGLDIGADGAEQVAVAVIAEIQAALNGRRGGLLRDRPGAIHAREDQGRFSAQSIACA